jgi:hypothetical protein
MPKSRLLEGKYDSKLSIMSKYRRSAPEYRLNMRGSIIVPGDNEFIFRSFSSIVCSPAAGMEVVCRKWFFIKGSIGGRNENG